MDRVAARTGGAGAIGGAIAKSLMQAGHAIAILDRDAAAAITGQTLCADGGLVLR